MTLETLHWIVNAPAVQRLQTSNHATIPDGLRWLEILVADYRKILLNEPFYQIATTATTIRDFAWARQLLHHSTKFPQVLALRRDLNYDHPYASRYRKFFGQHVVEEEGHADMLKDWLTRHGLVPFGENALAPIPTNATVACLAHAYTAAVTGTPAESIVALNVAVEAASYDFFNQLAPTLQKLDIDSWYWELHRTADEFHSADGLAMLDECKPNSPQGQSLARWAREAAIFWGAMLNSWVGIDRWPPIPA
jgi:hypothetical protein